MERRQLEYFVGVFEHLNLTRAAESLHVSQPAVSRSIRALEKELDTPLFRRTPGGLSPTEAAERILPGARRILGELTGLVDAARSGSVDVVGEPRIALTTSTSHEPMTSIVAELLERHPGVRTIGVLSENAAEAVAAVTRGSCDAALVGQERRPSGSQVRAETLLVEEIMLVVPPGSTFDSAERISTTELRGQRFIAAPPHTEMRALLDQLVVDLGCRIVAEVAHRDAIPLMVGRGLGLAFLPSTLRELVARAGARMRGLDPPVEVPVWAVTRTDPTPAAGAFLEVARHVARARR